MLIVAAIIVDSLQTPTRFLCAQRSAPPELDGQWEFPGGKVEPGETPEAALRREIWEELGVEISLGDQFTRPDGSDWPLPNGSDMRLWLATISAGAPEPLQAHHQLTWATRLTIADLAWLPGDVPIVEQLVHEL